MPKMTNDTVNNRWIIDYPISSATAILKINTQNYFVDKNIYVRTTATRGLVTSVNQTSTATLSLISTTQTTISLNHSINSTPTLTNIGWIENDNIQNGTINIVGELIIPNSQLSSTTIIPSASQQYIYLSPGYSSTTQVVSIPPATISLPGAYDVDLDYEDGRVIASTVFSNNNYGITTIQPSGNYLTITSTATSTQAISMTASAFVTTAGYLEQGSKHMGFSVNPIISSASDYYIPEATITGVDYSLSATASNSIVTSGISTVTTTTPYSIQAQGNSNVNIGAIKVNTTAGVVAAQNDIQLFSTTSIAQVKNSDIIYIPEAVASITLTAGNGNCTYSTAINATVSDVNSSGVAITFNGSGQVTGTADIITAGYAPKRNSYVTAGAISSSTASATKYITGVTLTPPASGTCTFSLTIPNGSIDEFITFNFYVDSQGNTTITD